jgi:hypothetical protein
MNYTATTLQGMSTAHLEHLRLQVCLDFFAPESTDADREVLEGVLEFSGHKKAPAHG